MSSFKVKQVYIKQDVPRINFFKLLTEDSHFSFFF
jgi:hypothetical protein